MTLNEALKDEIISVQVEPNDIRKGFNLCQSKDIKLIKREVRNGDKSTIFSFELAAQSVLYKYCLVRVIVDKWGEIGNTSCNCFNFYRFQSCEHVAAVLIKYYALLSDCKPNPTKISEAIINKFNSHSKNIIKKEVNVELKITCNFDEIADDRYYYSYYPKDIFVPKLSLGVTRQYLMNNHLNEFMKIYTNEEGELKFGKEFIYNPKEHYFSKENTNLLLAYNDYMQNCQYDKDKALKNMLNHLKNSTFILNDYLIEGIEDEFPISTNLVKSGDNYQVNFDLEGINNFIEDDYEYILYKGKIYHLNHQEQVLIQDLKGYELNNIIIKKDNFKNFTNGLFGILKKNLEIDGSVDDIVLPNNIITRLYFDIRYNKIIANPKFIYDQEEIEYFDNNSLVLRDMAYENQAINNLLSYGFMMEGKKITLEDLEKQVDFLEKGLDELASKYEIFTTERFKKTNIKRKTNITSMFGIGQDNIFSYQFNLGDDIKSEELVNIFKEIKNKKKYYRLKSGDILSLEDEALLELENLSEDLEFSDEDIRNGHGKILKYRAIYLDSLRASKYQNVIKTDNLFTNLINNFYQYKDSNLTLSKDELAVLRDYQLIGVKWLYNLAKTGFGGILADEMGLGKTIQVIYYIKQMLQENPEAKFLIVVPTSLAYNWEHEFATFADDIKRTVVVGNKPKRESLLANNDSRVFITTYGLLREDEDIYIKNHYHTMFIDEAQNIKNHNAGISKCVKEITADTKFALTGTPLENSILELWSIFDFIMPGYLANLTKFQTKYKIKDFNEDSDIIIKALNRQINPFILRRKKSDVTKELPPKLVNDIYIDLADSQKKLYVAELNRVREEMDKIMEDGGMSKARFMILQLLTKLRQICIDPSIVYENYDGESNKIATITNLVQEYTDNNHKILIFSSFRTALNIVNDSLNKAHIKTFMIDGSVNAMNRMQMVDDFNNKDDVKVFLIMLKSGGTGLNLTSADVVIHLDLWWNPQAENQATDRAHRIGQDKTVEVIHLVTKGTIEEKILELQKKKQMLSDKIIDGEARDKNIISELSQEDIQNLLSFDNQD